MASARETLELVLSATDASGGAFGSFGNNLAGVKGKAAEMETAINKTSDATKVVGDSMENLKTKGESVFASLKENWFAVGATLAGVGITLKKAFDLAAEAAKDEQARDVFKANIEMMGADAATVFQKIKEASGGIIDDSSIVAAANRAMAMGIPFKNIASLMEIARASARAMGLTASEAFDRIILGISNVSPRALKYAGILVSMKEATDGVASSGTIEAQQQALLNEVLVKGIKIVKEYGTEQLTAAEKLQKLTADWKNQKDELSEELLPILLDLVPVFEGLIKLLALVGSGVNLTIGMFKMLAAVTPGVISSILEPFALVEKGLNALGRTSSTFLQDLTKQFRHESAVLFTEAEENAKRAIAIFTTGSAQPFGTSKTTPVGTPRVQTFADMENLFTQQKAGIDNLSLAEKKSAEDIAKFKATQEETLFVFKRNQLQSLGDFERRQAQETADFERRQKENNLDFNKRQAKEFADFEKDYSQRGAENAKERRIEIDKFEEQLKAERTEFENSKDANNMEARIAFEKKQNAEINAFVSTQFKDRADFERKIITENAEYEIKKDNEVQENKRKQAMQVEEEERKQAEETFKFKRKQAEDLNEELAKQPKIEPKLEFDPILESLNKHLREIESDEKQPIIKPKLDAEQPKTEWEKLMDAFDKQEQPIIKPQMEIGNIEEILSDGIKIRIEPTLDPTALDTNIEALSLDKKKIDIIPRLDTSLFGDELSKLQTQFTLTPNFDFTQLQESLSRQQITITPIIDLSQLQQSINQTPENVKLDLPKQEMRLLITIEQDADTLLDKVIVRAQSEGLEILTTGMPV